MVKVFMTIIATKNSSHICELDAYKMGKKCNFKMADGSVDEVKVLDILKVLAGPDKRRKLKQGFDGRRIKAVAGGWLVLNGEKYRQMVSDEMRKARLRRAQDTYRRKHGKSSPLAGEVAAIKAMENGKEEEADAIAAGER